MISTMLRGIRMGVCCALATALITAINPSAIHSGTEVQVGSSFGTLLMLGVYLPLSGIIFGALAGMVAFGCGWLSHLLSVHLLRAQWEQTFSFVLTLVGTVPLFTRINPFWSLEAHWFWAVLCALSVIAAARFVKTAQWPHRAHQHPSDLLQDVLEDPASSSFDRSKPPQNQHPGEQPLHVRAQ